ncbi:hypothetical protein SAMN05660642_04417 [Geodermatophilus siccatus]|uniref:DUF6542 domain-containing protein n=1 Tax=Geodermatophilus siccatus TaxID=1137991 RepID=A0A1G9ZTJ0_9ACTN|nr:DUF6542 domain-containing protein [Geodermatophilus siccatus]SDN24427.1 hypothetical protein SAMN05660642_04417 [Geodermatophilus siccatus]
MASVRTADTWRESGRRADQRVAARPEGADYVSRIGRPPVPPPPPRMRSTDLPPFPEDMARTGRRRDDRPAPLPPRPSADRSARPAPRDAERGRPAARDADRPRGREDRPRDLPDLDVDRRRAPRSPEPRPAGRRPSGRGATARTSERGGRVRGALAVLAVFLVTLAAAALESWIGTGLGLATLGTLTAASVVATLVVRRSDLLTTVTAPPLVYVAVAALNTALAPSASLNLASVATLLIRGFPAMAVATAAAAVVGLIRWAARR